MPGSLLPLIVFVPGLRPKPEPHLHETEIVRSLLEGVRRVDPAVAADIEEHRSCFELVAWNFPFYGEHFDIENDRAGIDAVLKQEGASDEDRAEVSSFKRRLIRWVYKAADHIPFVVPQLASGKIELHLQDFRRYARDREGVAEATRQLLKGPLVQAMRSGRPTLLIGHSMGSVIAYDALWQLSHQSYDSYQLDTFLTLGSPLGQRYIQRRLLGHDKSGVAEFPTNIRRWVNITAYGDMTSIDVNIANDFAEMMDLGLIEAIEDRQVYNYFRQDGDGELNVHAEYGYLVNAETAAIIAAWWSAQRH